MTRAAPRRPAADLPPLADADALAPLGTPARPRPHWPGRDVTTGDVTLHVRHTPGPPGDTAVYVHGLGGSSTNWTELAGALSSRCEGLAVDLPGFGRSAPPASGDYTVAAHAEVVAHFLTGRDEPVHLLGNSLGGAVALTVAARHPELVRTLTLVSPAMPDLRPHPGRLGGHHDVLALLPVVGARARATLAEETPRERFARTMRLCHADPTRVSAAAFELAALEAEERATLPWAGEALHRSLRGLVGTWLVPPARSLWSLAGRVRVPTLVVWGDLDRLVSVRRAARTTAALPAGRLLRLPGVGHVAQIERPAVVGRAVLGLLDAAADGAWPAAAPVPARRPALAAV